MFYRSNILTFSLADELRRIAKGEILSDSWSREIYSVYVSHYTIKPSMILVHQMNQM